jgi:hypothetical protein
MESDYMTTAEQLIQRGREQGLQEGAAQGVAQGAAQVLLAQLEQRFGPLGEATVQHVRGASAKQLEQIARVILTAATLEAVLQA